MTEVTLRLDESQVVELVRQLSPQAKVAVLTALLPEFGQFMELTRYGSERIQTVAAEHNQDWTTMSDSERERFIDQLLHQS